ncbi:alpha/beta hydrolase family protein [Paenibacillus koleovorans]|uniref:alpha/beta hydrolase family protein n=1 Tax=Paenibacillus koleovorans TaxID=121608 RepID=UPI0013E3F256|nr:acetylxylan esterase [Paenibacillus koleovorans]
MSIRCSEFERRAHAGRESSYIDDYPERAEYRQNAFLRYLDSRSDKYLNERKRKVKAVRTPEDAAAYRDWARETFRSCVGPLPEMAVPGRVELIGTLDRGRYAVDRVRIEGLPGVFITANFYYPTGITSPGPAVLFACGHATDGKASPMYVSFGVEAATNGFCALVYDPIGQGDRTIASGVEAEPMGAVDAHCLVDRQLGAWGERLAPYFVAESVRALDYLLSRPEVDPQRVGVSGNSGGGMMSAYMGAYDDRLQAVAPSCYITELKAMLTRILAQDAEQCTQGFMEQGLDLSDLITAAAPRPYFVGAALYDFFPIEGVRDAMVEAKRLYTLLGARDRIDTLVASRGHGMWVETRLAILRFFSQAFDMPFYGNDEVDYEALPTVQELTCGRNAYDVQSYLSDRTSATSPSSSISVRERLVDVLKIDPTALGKTARLIGAEKYVHFESVPGLTLNGLLLDSAVAGANSDKLNIVIGPLPKEGDSAAEAYRGQFDGGWLYVEPRGIGESAMHPDSSFHLFDVETGACYHARLLGETLQGMRVQDTAAAVSIARELPGCHQAEIILHGQEEHALTALYSAALLDGVSGIRVQGLLDSFRSFQSEPADHWGHAIYVPGLGWELDVDDVLGLFQPGQATVSGRLDYKKQWKESRE